MRKAPSEFRSRLNFWGLASAILTEWRVFSLLFIFGRKSAKWSAPAPPPEQQPGQAEAALPSPLQLWRERERETLAQHAVSCFGGWPVCPSSLDGQTHPRRLTSPSPSSAVPSPSFPFPLLLSLPPSSQSPPASRLPLPPRHPQPFPQPASLRGALLGERQRRQHLHWGRGGKGTTAGESAREGQSAPPPLPLPPPPSLTLLFSLLILSSLSSPPFSIGTKAPSHFFSLSLPPSPLSFFLPSPQTHRGARALPQAFSLFLSLPPHFSSPPLWLSSPIRSSLWSRHIDLPASFSLSTIVSLSLSSPPHPAPVAPHLLTSHTPFRTLSAPETRAAAAAVGAAAAAAAASTGDSMSRRKQSKPRQIKRKFSCFVPPPPPSLSERREGRGWQEGWAFQGGLSKDLAWLGKQTLKGPGRTGGGGWAGKGLGRSRLEASYRVANPSFRFF